MRRPYASGAEVHRANLEAWEAGRPYASGAIMAVGVFRKGSDQVGFKPRVPMIFIAGVRSPGRAINHCNNFCGTASQAGIQAAVY